MSVFLLSKVFIGLRRSLQVEVESCGFVGLGESRCECARVRLCPWLLSCSVCGFSCLQSYYCVTWKRSRSENKLLVLTRHSLSLYDLGVNIRPVAGGEPSPCALLYGRNGL